MSEEYLESVNQHTEKALKVLKKMDLDKKFSEFARDKFNEAGIRAGSSKAEDMLDELYDIGFGVNEIVDKEGNKVEVKKTEPET